MLKLSGDDGHCNLDNLVHHTDGAAVVHFFKVMGDKFIVVLQQTHPAIVEVLHEELLGEVRKCSPVYNWHATRYLHTAERH